MFHMWNSYLIADLTFDVISEIMNCKKEKPMYLVVKERKRQISPIILICGAAKKSLGSERNVKDNWLSKCGDEEEMARGLNAIGGGRQ